MKLNILSRTAGATLLAATALTAATAAYAEVDTARQIRVTPNGIIITPGSSIPRPGEIGIAHTNVHIFVPNGGRLPNSAPSGKYETPASLACVYGLTTFTSGCNPETLTTVATGGSKIVAIVDAFDDPTATNDITTYSKQFGLPPITKDNFAVVYATGTQPAQDPTGGWELEESLDIEMAHALAPGAMVILVEAKSNSTKNLLVAEATATKLVEAAGGGEVSNSWAGGESAGEEKYEADFAGTNVVYFASAGDSPGTGWPSVMSNVVSVGGTFIERDGNANYEGQEPWISTGGGLSKYVKTPAYQKKVTKIVGTQRGTPDIALDASPASGVWLYDTTPYNGSVLDWTVVGGTSVASPATAAIINNAGAFAATTSAELTTVYGNMKNKADFTDITGPCTNAKNGKAGKGYDLCTGVGTPLGLSGK